MTKKHEGLVEEIAEELGGICDPMASYHPSKEEYLRDVARTFITLILSAIQSGELKILGEETRIKGVEIPQLDGYRDVIALRDDEAQEKT